MHKRKQALRVAKYVAMKFFDTDKDSIPEVLEFLVFGSAARNGRKVGDLDLAVIFIDHPELDAISLPHRLEEIEIQMRADKRLARIKIDFIPFRVEFLWDHTMRDYYRRAFRDPLFIDQCFDTVLRYSRKKERFVPTNERELARKYSRNYMQYRSYLRRRDLTLK